MIETDDVLTEQEYALLRTAIQEGYFNVPREATLVDIAEEHDLADREASEQLRTALDSVLRRAFDEQGGR